MRGRCDCGVAIAHVLLGRRERESKHSRQQNSRSAEPSESSGVTQGLIEKREMFSKGNKVAKIKKINFDKFICLALSVLSDKQMEPDEWENYGNAGKFGKYFRKSFQRPATIRQTEILRDELIRGAISALAIYKLP